MAGVAFAVEGDGVGFAIKSYAASALYTTLASLSGALWRIKWVRCPAYSQGEIFADFTSCAAGEGGHVPMIPPILREGKGRTSAEQIPRIFHVLHCTFRALFCTVAS